MERETQAKSRQYMGTSIPDDVKALREQLLQGLLRSLSIIGLVVAIAGTYISITNGEIWIVPVYWGTYVVILLFTFWQEADYRLRVWMLIGLSYALAATDFLEDGLGGSARAFLLIVPFLAGLLLERRAAIIALIGSVLLAGGFGALYVTGILALPSFRSAIEAPRWIAVMLVILMLGMLILVGLNYFFQRLVTALIASRDLAEDLETQRAELAHQVEERTATLERRARYLQATTEVSRGASALLDDPDALLQRVVDLIDDEFGFYHTGLLLMDETGEWIELNAASSEGGRHILERGYRMRVGVQGIVGYVADRGEPRIVSDVTRDVFFQYEPDVPETRSEIALPLRVRGEIIGVLDVQSSEPGAFDEEVVLVLQSLADEVAIAINNARLFQQLQETAEAERQVRGEFDRVAWAEQIRRQPNLGFVKEEGVISPVGATWDQDMLAVVKHKEVIVADEDVRRLTLPIQVGEQVIAVMDVHLPEEEPAWSSERISLMEALSVQLGQTLERARLYQETQQRVAREQLTREVTTRVREPLDIELVLQTAVREIGERLGVEAEVWLGMDLATDE